ncbi:hypothetical protein CRENBAI_020524 [Crenichthys baileyi]|uniref:Secreted protein n=1 Tax=Crenichthys baileyi TaxID=28760 RepID=A0AAV9R5P0_9TELE
MSSVPSLSACLILISFWPPGFCCSVLPTSDIFLASDLWTPTSFLPPDCRLLPNPWIHLPESAFPVLTPFLSPDHRPLSSHWAFKPMDSCLCDISVITLHLIKISERVF